MTTAIAFFPAMMSFHPVESDPDDDDLRSSPTAKEGDKESLVSLGNEYVPRPKDVICGRGNTTRNHNGNVHFRMLIEASLPRYLKAKSKTDKSVVVSEIVGSVREEGGEFVRQDESQGEWYKVCERALREKVGQSLRDALHTQYRSSTQAKKRRKKVENVQQHHDVTNLLGTTNGVMTRLANEVKEETPNSQALDMFNAANIFILQELKRKMNEANNHEPPPSPPYI